MGQVKYYVLEFEVKSVGSVSFGLSKGSSVSLGDGYGKLIVRFDNEGRVVGWQSEGSLTGGVKVKVFQWTHVLPLGPVWIQINLNALVGCDVSAHVGDRVDLLIRPFLEGEFEALVYSRVGGSGYIQPHVKIKYFSGPRTWVFLQGPSSDSGGK